METDVPRRTARLLLIALSLIVLFSIQMTVGPLFNSQFQHLRAIDRHIKKIEPLWNDFRNRIPASTVLPFFITPAAMECSVHMGW